AAPAVRPGALGGSRDRLRLVRLHGRRRPQRRAGGGRGAGCGRMALMTEELAFAGAAKQAQLVRDKEISPRELTELYLGRIERHDPKVNSYRTVFAEQALAEADEAGKRASKRGDKPPLLGVPVAIKDNVDYAGDIT